MDRDALSSLRVYTRLTERLKAGGFDADARQRLEARLEEAKLALTARHIDPDWLLPQRWVVAKYRQAAAFAGNPDLDGQIVALSGYFIPAFQAIDGSSVGYLVSQPGMCSHLPTPPPNQLVRLALPAGIDGISLYDPAVVQGTLTLMNTTQTVFIVDGNTRMRSAWTLHVDDMRSEPVAPDRLSPWNPRLPWAHRPVRQKQNPGAQATDSAGD